MYQIRSESAKTIIERKNIKLPRFQRKQTWDKKKNFILCISIFHGFPIGSFVINDEPSSSKSSKTNSWLLDGRQRRNALKSIIENPENIYVWGKSFLGIKDPDSVDEIKDKYWRKIDEHLESDVDDNNTNDQEENLIGESDEEEFDELDEEDHDEKNQIIFDDSIEDESAASSYDTRDLGLSLLLDIILLCHKKNKYSSGFSTTFNYTKYLDRLNYAKFNGTRYELDGKKITLLIKEFTARMIEEDKDNYTRDDFYDFFINKFILKDNKETDFKVEIARNWKKIKRTIDIVEQIESKIQETIIGIIELKSVRSSDSQNIFKLINSTGTDLTAVEILSAKPSWNVVIPQPSTDLVNAVNEIYAVLDVKREANNVVKWDFPATLLGRLINLDFIFKELNYKDDTQFKTKVTLGFKLLAAINEDGITKEKISLLAKSDKLDWNNTDNIVNDLNLMGKVLKDDGFFRYLKSWNTNLMSLTTDAIAINFTALIYKNWITKGKPLNGSNYKKFRNESVILFDRMIFEYSTRVWRGSSDSKVAENIKSFNPSLTFEQIPTDAWQSLIKNLLENNLINNSKVTSHEILKPILYYAYFLQEISGPNDSRDKIEIDHIIPQSAFNVSSNIDKEYKNNLTNLTLFIKKDNISKSDRTLADISVLAKSHPNLRWVLEMLIRNTKIDEIDMIKFSSADKIYDLIEYRRDFFEKAFQTKRLFFFGINI